MPEYANLLDARDDEDFVRVVRHNLDDGAPGLHGITPQEYVIRCRECWRGCGTDAVYKVKLIIDKQLLDHKKPKDWPPKGFEKISEDSEPPEDIYCVSLALVDMHGDYIDAPPGYEGPGNLPGYHSVLPTRKIPEELQDPEGPVPTDYLIAVIDVLGFSKRLETVGLQEMHRLYGQLLSVAFKPNVDDPPWRRMVTPIGDGLFCPSLAYLPLNHAYFSDTLLMWVPLEPNRVVLFLERLACVFCEALRLQMPLRGAVSIGQAIMHKPSNTYIGNPIVEAARLEKEQEWTGLACGASFKNPPRPIPLPITSFVEWQTPMKTGKKSWLSSFLGHRRGSSSAKEVQSTELLSGLVMDWPRKWREMHGGSAVETLKILRGRNPKFRSYYDNALSFVEFSDANPEWFMKMPGPRGRKDREA